mmetsp:Transcript_31141/g.71200  ORF Transcript_31141/g.71200 Transcript_31141/m.71200 type:complete len:298 (-) Transcript_31141:659-1552(-)
MGVAPSAPALAAPACTPMGGKLAAPALTAPAYPPTGGAPNPLAHAPTGVVPVTPACLPVGAVPATSSHSPIGAITKQITATLEKTPKGRMTGVMDASEVLGTGVSLTNINKKGLSGPYLTGDVPYILLHLNLTKSDFEFWLRRKKMEWGRMYVVPPTKRAPTLLVAPVSKSIRTSITSDVLDLLILTDTYKSMDFSPKERWSILEESMWDGVMVCQRLHIDQCLLQKSSEFATRNRRLILLDMEYYKSFCNLFNTKEKIFSIVSSIWKSCLYEFYFGFFKISRKLDYADHTNLNLPR